MTEIEQLYRPVLMLIINLRFVAVRRNRASVTQQRGQLMQELKMNDLPQRRFVDVWALGSSAENTIFFNEKNYFSDESHFWFNGYVYEQNCQKDQPKAIQSKNF